MKKLSDHNGCEISGLLFLPPVENMPLVRPKEGERFVLSSEYYGDHAENWVVIEKGGVETMRHNAVTIDTIEWKPAPAKGEGR
jgi:hypothetical protein